MQLIEAIQTELQPEIALLFYNGPENGFEKTTESLIDNVVQSSYVEYLQHDLTKFESSGKQTHSGGLLGGDEKIGMHRLVEALQCCMWSNMTKKNVDH